MAPIQDRDKIWNVPNVNKKEVGMVLLLTIIRDMVELSRTSMQLKAGSHVLVAGQGILVNGVNNAGDAPVIFIFQKIVMP